ncbi:DUF6463 family protein [Thiolinea disciformis]|uniref:DUF6463 family protein n=1 Tax=Thiolinea disciformis TaxID=125614 RepID=UPI00037B2DAC|nr:DUF6463 family protein [Thiolinea disciformis]
MKVWIGYWLMFVALIHTLVMIVLFPSVLAEIVKRGIVNSVGNDPLIGAVTWFGLFGILLFILGMAIKDLERAGQGIPLSMAWAMLILTVLGIILMPVSGFWLALPAVVGIFLQQRQLKAKFS